MPPATPPAIQDARALRIRELKLRRSKINIPAKTIAARMNVTTNAVRHIEYNHGGQHITDEQINRYEAALIVICRGLRERITSWGW